MRNQRAESVSRRAGIVLFALMTALACALLVAVCSGYQIIVRSAVYLSGPPPAVAAEFLVHLYLLVMALGLLAYAGATGSFFVGFALTAVLSGPVIMLELIGGVSWSWLVFLLVAGVCTLLWIMEKKGVGKHLGIGLSIYMVFIVFSALEPYGIVTLPVIIHMAREYSVFLDLRWIGAAVLLSAFVTLAITETARVKMPAINMVEQKIEPHRRQARPGAMGDLASLFSAMLDLLVSAAVAIINAVLLVSAHIVLYLYQFLRCFFGIVWRFMTAFELWLPMGSCFALAALIFGLSRLCRRVAPLLCDYLVADTSLEQFQGEIVVRVVGSAVAIGLYVAIFLAFSAMLLELRKGWTSHLLFGAMMVVSAGCLGGYVMYAASYLGLVELSGFEHLGVLSLLILIGLGAALMLRISLAARAEDEL